MIKPKSVTKQILGAVSLVALVAIIAIAPYNRLKAEEPMIEGPNTCCLNGYKIWDDPNPLEADQNFQHCGCTWHKGNDPTACSCPSDLL